MEFNEVKKLLQESFKGLSSNVTHLYEVNLDKDELYNLYLDSFPEGTNPMHRQRREYDCSCCRSFIRHIGNVVAIINGQVKTIWDFKTGDPVFQPVIDALDKFVKSKPITDVYFSKFAKIGTDKNYEFDMSNPKKIGERIAEWHHFYLELPKKFVDTTSRSLGDLQGELRDPRNVFKRSLEEITEDSILTVLELIGSNSLYKGEEWKSVLTEFLRHKRAYTIFPDKDIYAWDHSLKAGVVMSKIRNHSMGTLLVDISNNVELDTAVKSYEKIVAGPNYKRPSTIFTQRQYDEAKKTIEEQGYLDSLERRYATLDDINVTNILFSNKDCAKRIAGARESMLDLLAKDIAITPKNFSKVEEIAIDDFINNVLPTATQLELFFDNKLTSNLVSLIAPKNPGSKTMFKWNNGFSWAYTGNITDSFKQQVKEAGGNVEGVLRFSIKWNDNPQEHDGCDLDAHCKEPGGNLIYYSKKNNRNTTGALDVDIITPEHDHPAVENITWTDKNRMEIGDYTFYTHGFGIRGKSGGFRGEIEFDGQIHSFDYQQPVRADEKVKVATVTLNKDGTFTIKNHLPSSTSSKEIWSINTNQFIPVSVAMFSPNYWDQQNGVGHRHYMFMLKDCVNTESPSGFYNEFLKQELLAQKNVMAALGSKMRVENVADQLSGVAFSSTKRTEIVMKVVGQTQRILKVKI